jgi:hypothetical protein
MNLESRVFSLSCFRDTIIFCYSCILLTNRKWAVKSNNDKNFGIAG